MGNHSGRPSDGSSGFGEGSEKSSENGEGGGANPVQGLVSGTGDAGERGERIRREHAGDVSNDQSSGPDAQRSNRDSPNRGNAAPPSNPTPPPGEIRRVIAEDPLKGLELSRAKMLESLRHLEDAIERYKSK